MPVDVEATHTLGGKGVPKEKEVICCDGLLEVSGQHVGTFHDPCPALLITQTAYRCLKQLPVRGKLAGKRSLALQDVPILQHQVAQGYGSVGL